MLKTELGWVSARTGPMFSVNEGFRWQPGGGDPALNSTAVWATMDLELFQWCAGSVPGSTEGKER